MELTEAVALMVPVQEAVAAAATASVVLVAVVLAAGMGKGSLVDPAAFPPRCIPPRAER